MTRRNGTASHKQTRKKPGKAARASTNGHEAAERAKAMIEEPKPDPILWRGHSKPACALTDAELLNLLGQIDAEQQAIDTERARFEAAKKESAARVAVLQATVSELWARFRRREEQREVSVEVRADYPAGLARSIRLDTGEVFFTR